MLAFFFFFLQFDQESGDETIEITAASESTMWQFKASKSVDPICPGMQLHKSNNTENSVTIVPNHQYGGDQKNRVLQSFLLHIDF